MANKVILIDTSILIDYYRKTDKKNSSWFALIQQDYEFAISAISKYEIYSGATQSQLTFWDTVLQSVTIIPFDEICVNSAVSINTNLKRKRKQLDLADLFIAATALTHALPIATMNRKHFDRVDDLKILD